ncbi:MAG: transglycosylase SLT domain-containing protein, partial [Gammaproteobacteria bacterium]
VFTTEATTLLPIIEANDPSGFLTHCLVINPDWAVQELNNLHYPINSFIALVMRYYGSAYAKKLQKELPDLAICNFSEVFTLNDLHIYGQKRLGVQNENLTIISTNFIGAIVNNNLITGPACNYPLNYTPPDYTHHLLGRVSYELSNHLGNVMVTISDRKIAHSTNGTTVDYYMPDEKSATDYYAFGSAMNNRNWSAPSEKYKFGFNGMMKDNEITGQGNNYSALYWEYDTRVGRRWNTDPVLKPGHSPYECFEDNPIWFSDPSGDDPTNPKKHKKHKPKVDNKSKKLTTQEQIDQNIKDGRAAINNDPATSNALKNAANISGEPLGDLTAFAITESTGNKNAHRKGSGYYGLMQMGHKAFNEVKKNKLTKDLAKGLTWNGVKTDVNQNALAGSLYYKISEASLIQANQVADVPNIYMAYQQGAQGAIGIFNGIRINPDSVLGTAQKAQHADSIKTLKQFRDLFQQKIKTAVTTINGK